MKLLIKVGLKFILAGAIVFYICNASTPAVLVYEIPKPQEIGICSSGRLYEDLLLDISNFFNSNFVDKNYFYTTCSSSTWFAEFSMMKFCLIPIAILFSMIFI